MHPRHTPHPKLTRTPRRLRRARTGYAYQPPALGTHRTHRAACPQGPTYCTYGVRVPASGDRWVRTAYCGHPGRTCEIRPPPEWGGAYCKVKDTVAYAVHRRAYAAFVSARHRALRALQRAVRTVGFAANGSVGGNP